MSDTVIIESRPTQHLQTVAKSLIERVFAAAALVMFLPLFALIAIAIKLDSRGPVLFLQPRTGKDGKVFQIFKFRSMTIGADSAQAHRNDPRVTRIGGFLRKTSLDELPQLMNVVLGDMAIVGPRPHAVVHDKFYAQHIPNYMQRYSVKPGLTGWAQVNKSRGETDTVDKMMHRTALDLEYVHNWSLLLDMRIILVTPKVLLTTDQAY